MTLQFTDTLRGTAPLPASKSISNRALFINATMENPCSIVNLAQCDDTEAMLRVVSHKETGNDFSDAGIEPAPTRKRKAGLKVEGMADLFGETTPRQKPAKDNTAAHTTINVGAAGTAMRFATALLSIRQDKQYLLCGSERMHQRPIRVLVDALRTLGADITYRDKEGFPPLIIKGRKLAGTTVELTAEVSSQYVSALLMLGPLLPHGLQVRLRGEITSRPYINLTLAAMKAFGAEAIWIGDNTLYVHAGGYHRTQPLRIEQDWSAASYWYELMALSPDQEAQIELPGLTRESIQGDSRVADFFTALGVRTLFTDTGATLTKQSVAPISLLRLDLSDQPDLAQTLVVTCAMAGIPFHFTGLQSLRIKETDRLAALQHELAKFGVNVQVRLDSEMLWDGHTEQPQTSIAVDTYDDHRMAMAFAPCALKHPDLRINNPEVVSKSYPTFWDALKPFLV